MRHTVRKLTVMEHIDKMIDVASSCNTEALDIIYCDQDEFHEVVMYHSVGGNPIIKWNDTKYHYRNVWIELEK